MSNGWKPYLYMPQESTSQFDPKPFTRASFIPPAPPKPRHEGPLLDFNRHPDDWRQDRYGLTNAIPMPASTKKKVAIMRWLQFSLRLLIMLSATALLVGTIMIKGVQDTANWLIRLVPGLDMLLTAYSLYHLARPSKLLTPGSTASYHWFALVMDICLIPLYIWIGLADRWNLNSPPDMQGRWFSFFTVQDATDGLMEAIWIVCMAVAGLHLVAGINCIYLACMFRKIANLPPDMNPLEDNLTSRRHSKHKHKSSEASNSVYSSASGHDEILSEKDRPVSFLSTRETNSPQFYSPHTPNTAMMSREDLAVADAVPTLYSRSGVDIASSVNLPRAQTFSTVPKQPSGLSRMLSVAASSIYSSRSRSSSTRSNSPPNLPRKSSKRGGVAFNSTEKGYSRANAEDRETHDSVFVLEEDPDESELGDAYDRQQAAQHPAHGSQDLDAHRYEPVRQTSFLNVNLHDTNGDLAMDEVMRASTASSAANSRFSDPRLDLQPLRMNPPTPPPAAKGAHLGGAAAGWPLQGTRSRPQTPQWPLAPTSGNANAGTASPRASRHYGDLSRGGSPATLTERDTDYGTGMPAREPGMQTRDWLSASPAVAERAKAERRDRRAKFAAAHADGGVGRAVLAVPPSADRKGRVVSASGADAGEGVYGEDGVDGEILGQGARRVSGKVAEEGLAGWGGGWRRRVSGRGR